MVVSFATPLSNFQGSVGVPLPSVEVKIINNGKIVTDGTPGELHIKGPSVFQGYVNILVMPCNVYTNVCGPDIGIDPKPLKRASPKMGGSLLGIQQVCLRLCFTSTWRHLHMIFCKHLSVCSDGFYHILGRTSVDIIKSGGFKIRLETCLLGWKQSKHNIFVVNRFISLCVCVCVFVC